MDLNCTREDLVNLIKPVVRAIPSRAVMPADAWLLIAAEDDHLRITGGNTDCQITAKIEADCNVNGIVAVDSKPFIELMSNLSAPEVSFKFVQQVSPKDATSDHHLGILSLEAGDALSYFNTMNHFDFTVRPQAPDADDSNSITVDGAALDEALQRILITATYNQERPNLYGANVCIRNGAMVFVSSDSLRLTVCRVPMLNDGPHDWNITIPAHSLRHIKNILRSQPATFTLSENGATLTFNCGDFELTTALIAATYADWESIPTEVYKWSFLIEPQDLQKLVASATAFSHHDMAALRFSPASVSEGDDPNRIYTQCEHQEIGSIDNSAPISGLVGVPEIVDMNYNFIRDVTRMKLNHTVKLSMPDLNSAININMPENPNFFHLMAPLQARRA